MFAGGTAEVQKPWFLLLTLAAGPDGLSTEHLVHAHPALIIHLSLLFKGMTRHKIVPDPPSPK